MGYDNENTAHRVAWVKLGSIWWPGKLLNEDEYSDEMKAEVNAVKNSKRSKASPENINVVKYFNENDYIVTTNAAQILLDVAEEKKVDIVKRVLTSMKSSKLSARLEEFKRDVIDAEKFLNPYADLTDLMRLFNGESSEPKRPTGVSKYADIFPSPKSEKPNQTSQTPASKGKAGIKYNFPSSRIISVASSKSPSKISPLPSDPSKKYGCSKCPYFSDRVNNVTVHMKYCTGIAPAQSKKNISPASARNSMTTPTTLPKAKASPVKQEKPLETPKAKTSPAKQIKVEVPTATNACLLTTPRRPGRPPRKAMPVVVTPVYSAKKAEGAVAAKSLSPVSVVTPKKRGRRTNKDKQLIDKQKAEILQDWNDSSSEENDSDDDLAPMMPPTKPPELFLFGSEKNKKRKAESSPVEEKSEGDEGAKPGTDEVTNEDQPPVLKKPRTDKELSDAFEALLKNTKPEYEDLLGKDLPTKEQEEDKMEVEEEEPQLSDIEEDAHIVMKKSDLVLAVSNECEHNLKNENFKGEVELSADMPDAKKENDVKVNTKSERNHNDEKSNAIQPKVIEEPTTTTDDQTTPASPPAELRRSSRRGDRKSETILDPISSVVDRKVGSRRGRRGSSKTNAVETKTAESIQNGCKDCKDPVEENVNNLENPATTFQAEKITLKSNVELFQKSEVEVPIITAQQGNEKNEPKKPLKQETPPKQFLITKIDEESTNEVPAVPEMVAIISDIIADKNTEEIVSKGNPKEGTAKISKTAVSVVDKANVAPTIPVEKPNVVPADKPLVELAEKSKADLEESLKSKVVVDHPKTPPSIGKAVQKEQLGKSVSPVKTTLPQSVISSDSLSEQSKPVQEHRKEIVTSRTPTQLAPHSKAKSPTKVELSSPAKSSVLSASVKSVPPSTKSSSGSLPATVGQILSATSSPLEVVQKETPATLPPASAAIIPTKKGAEKRLPAQKKLLETSKPSISSSVVPDTSATVPSSPGALTSSSKTSTAPAMLQQKKPTAAVRPLVDNKEKETVPLIPTPVKEVKSIAPPTGAATRETQKVAATVATVASTEESTSTESKEQSPALVTQRVVHLVPVENADGSITYMLLSLENGSENQSVVLDQSAGDASASTVLRLDKVESVEPGQPNAQNLPINPNEVEGIFLDKEVENANHIVNALAAAAVEPGSATATSVMDAAATAYVTLAVDPTGTGMALASSSDGSGPSGTQSIVLPEVATTAVSQDVGGEQQVFYMTEDGALLDPQSLGLTFEQLQQLLNQ